MCVIRVQFMWDTAHNELLHPYNAYLLCYVCMRLAECGMPPIVLYIVTIASTGLCKSVSGWPGIVIHLLWVLKHHTQQGHETGINITCFTIWHLIAERISARIWIEDLFSQSTYVCTWWVMLRNVTWNVVTYHRHRYRPYVRHTVWHIQIRSTQIDHGWRRWRSGTAQRGNRGLDTTNTKQLLLQQA